LVAIKCRDLVADIPTGSEVSTAITGRHRKLLPDLKDYFKHGRNFRASMFYRLLHNAIICIRQTEHLLPDLKDTPLLVRKLLPDLKFN